jgi:hypothetical protein
MKTFRGTDRIGICTPGEIKAVIHELYDELDPQINAWLREQRQALGRSVGYEIATTIHVLRESKVLTIERVVKILPQRRRDVVSHLRPVEYGEVD